MITKERAKQIISNFKDKKILIIGDLILDKYLWGEVERISPEAPVPVVDVKKETVNLGGACNVAWNISTLGAKASIVGVVGKDENGKILKNMLVEKNIEPILIEDETRPTTEKTRIIAVSQQLIRIDKESKEKLSKNVKEDVIKKVKNIIEDFDAVIISDYGKGVVSRELIEISIKAKKPVFVDPKPSNFHLYEGITIMTPNKKEAYECIKESRETPIEEVGKKIKEKLRTENLLITLGSEGMMLFEGDKITHIPAKAKKVFDVTGAGDTVISVLTVSKVSGATWEEAASLSNYAGGWVVGEIGTVAIDSKTLLSLVP
ncbi:D-glycero-beta-D-manno-heptose-7-phosphate kinase [Hydrogenothermus marinus]|uniref:RfaE bifunctional protein kinase chain/domain n=1 Tax=Hydrogenothermus marinus TaxID=133270 RepID=A0A3M0BNP2_9AQUI|nr:D-glycero-beta-D-manno-heptose-7-phosphate kinase [Hydrogenothermus marinus]RMA97909.1 rfaE bifunctional protein kinase chain/domain [Hydrogenothermus marinus]